MAVIYRLIPREREPNLETYFVYSRCGWVCGHCYDDITVSGVRCHTCGLMVHDSEEHCRCRPEFETELKD